MQQLRWVLVTALLMSGDPRSLFACDTCECSFNARQASEQSAAGGMITTPTATTLGQGHATVGFLFEHQRFNSIPAGDAHALNGDGHDIQGRITRNTTTSPWATVCSRTSMFSW